MKYLRAYENSNVSKFKVGEFVKKDNRFGVLYAKVDKVWEGFGKVFWYDLTIYNDDGSTNGLTDLSVAEHKIYKLTDEDGDFVVRVSEKKYNL